MNRYYKMQFGAWVRVIYCLTVAIGVFIVLYNTRKGYLRFLVPQYHMGRVARNVEEKHDKWIVVTSIQRPTFQMKQLAKIPGWKLVVVGDRKSPKDWKLPGVTYLDIAAQKHLKYRIHNYLPYDSYTRKAIGYLYAIENGATFIYETDDDNNPYDNLKLFHIPDGLSTSAVVAGTKNLNFNPYQHFGQSSLWPRGYPLDSIGQDHPHIYNTCVLDSVPAIQQGLVNGDPDMDAIFRLTRKHESVTLDLKFDGAAPPVILPNGVFAPYNSQNTMFTAQAFWSLILPISVTVRASDIYRSYWAQRLLWLTGSNVAFYPSTAYQQRNAHSYIKDAAEEAELYQNMGHFAEFLSQWTCKGVSFFDCALALTEELISHGFLKQQDLELINAWFTDLASVGYTPPALKDSPTVCVGGSDSTLLFYAWEQNTTMSFTPHNVLLPVLDSNIVTNTNTVAEYCGKNTAFCMSKNGTLKYETGEYILLIVSVYDTKMIPLIDALYRPHFPHILYCGKNAKLEQLEQKYRISFTNLDGSLNAASCISRAVEIGYGVQGYLHISASMLLTPQSVASRNRNQIWSMTDPEVHKSHVMEQCNDQSFHCISFNWQKLAEIQRRLENVPGASLKQQLEQCFKKASHDEKFNTDVKYLRDPVFYLPSRLVASFKRVVKILHVNETIRQYSFLAFILMDCMEPMTEHLHSTNLQELEGVKYDVIVPVNLAAIGTETGIRKEYCNLMDWMCE